MDELEKVINTWGHAISHDKGQLSKGMRELIIETIRLLEELRNKRQKPTEPEVQSMTHRDAVSEARSLRADIEQRTIR